MVRQPSAATTSGTAVASNTASLSLNGFQLLQMIDPNTGWLVTSDQVLRTTDGGRTWTDVSPPTTGPLTARQFSAATFHSGELGWLANSRMQNGHPVGVTVFHTTDGGRNWSAGSLGSSSQGFATTITFVDATHGWILVNDGAFAGSDAIGLFGTTDGGAHWTLLVQTKAGQASDHGLPLGGDKNGIAFLDTTTGWMTGHSNGNDVWFYVTHDGGHNWQPQTLPLPMTGRIGGSLTTESPLLVGGQDGTLPVSDAGPPAKMRFFTTTDGGQRWTPAESITFPAGAPFPPMTFWLNTRDGWTTNGMTVDRTTDGGQHWQQLDANEQWGRPYQLDFVTAQLGWAVIEPIGSRQSQLLKTTDGGRTWSPVAATVQS